MIVYHGTTVVVRFSDVLHSYRNLDFGKGFYVTTVREQAVRWARRKADLLGSARAVVNAYEMRKDGFGVFRVRDFGGDMAAWIDFVCLCRDGGEAYRDFDLIIGKVADDKVYRVVDLYKNGVWDRDRALLEMKVYEKYDQIAFITQTAIDSLLSFSGCCEV